MVPEKVCARTMQLHCDLDGSGHLEYSEWLVCVKPDGKKKEYMLFSVYQTPPPPANTIKNYGMNFIASFFLTGSNGNEIFFHHKKLTSTGIGFSLNKTLFTHFDCEHVEKMTQNRKLLISLPTMRHFIRSSVNKFHIWTLN